MIPVPPLAPAHAGALVNPARRPTAFAASDDRPAPVWPVLALAFVVAALAGLAPPAAGQCEYDVTVLPCLYVGDYPLCPTPTGMNNVGQIVGYIDAVGGESAQGFVWSEMDGLQLLPRPTGVYAVRPRDINDAGMIVGEFNSPGRAFLWDGAAYTELGIPPGGTFSNAQAINEAGVVVGTWGNNVVGPGQVAFMWQDGVITDLGPMLAANSSNGNAVNDRGVVAGRKANNFLMDDRAFQIHGDSVATLPPIPGGYTSEARAQNAFGDICGLGRLPQPGFEFGARRAFAWLGGKFFVMPPMGEGTHSACTDMSDDQRVVGYADQYLSFLFSDDLITVLDNQVSDYKILYAWCIDQKGRIAATVDGPGGVSHAGALLTPRTSPADVTGDCEVSLEDLLLVLTEYGCSGGGCSADVDLDGAVGLTDIALVISNWSN